MIVTIFWVLVSMAVAGSAVCLAAMLLSVGLHRRLPVGAGYLLRLLALVFFLLPVGWLVMPQSVVELLPELPVVVQSHGNGTVLPAPSPPEPSLLTDQAALDGDAVVLVLFGIWIAGTAVCLVRYGLHRMSYRQYLRRLPCLAVPESVRLLLKQKAALLRPHRVPKCIVCPELPSPMLVGLLHPCLLLPEEATQWKSENLGPVLLHELTHFRRGDLWWKLFAEINRCLFWWDPLAWRLVREIEQYSELSCDEAVVLRLEQEERKSYGWSILRTAEQLCREPENLAGISLRGVVGQSQSRDVQILRRRLQLIMESKKTSKTGAVLILCAVLAVGMVGLLVGCAASPEKPVQVVSATAEPDAPVSSQATDDIGGEPEASQPTSDAIDPMYYPLDVYISQPYGGEREHTGVDLTYTTDAAGRDIYAVQDGVVTFAGWADADGYMVKLQHGDGMETSYAHCGKLLVTAGDEVAQGQVIAKIGSTGNATGPHLHFEVRVDGEPQDPMEFVPELLP